MAEDSRRETQARRPERRRVPALPPDRGEGSVSWPPLSCPPPFPLDAPHLTESSSRVLKHTHSHMFPQHSASALTTIRTLPPTLNASVRVRRAKLPPPPPSPDCTQDSDYKKRKKKKEKEKNNRLRTQVWIMSSAESISDGNGF